jgi:hypothetical protein
MGDLIELKDKTDNPIHWKVKDALEHARNGLDEDPQYGNKCIILMLDNENPDNYNIRAITAGFERTSEIISLLEIEISLLKREMGF